MITFSPYPPYYYSAPPFYGLTPCGCQCTGHSPGCWFYLGGIYINGVKVAPSPVMLPPPIVIHT